LMDWRIVLGKAEDWAVSYQGEPFHALLCDPPYELGFMGKDWDRSGVAFKSETWAALAEHLHPGAFGMAFASARGWHRLAVAIEDAGLRIHPSIFGWTYGSGFPKATRISADGKSGAWEGYRYGLQALKPALEPIIVFQKPYEGKPVDSITETGAGALWIDGARIEFEEGGTLASNPSLREKITGGNGGHISAHKINRRFSVPHEDGRWPANLVLDSEAAKRLDEMSRLGKSGTAVRRNVGRSVKARIQFAKGNKGAEMRGDISYGDSGGTSRFFFRYQWEELNSVDPLFYCPKASRRERDAGLGEFPAKRAGSLQGTHDGSMKTGSGNERNPFYRNSHPTVKPIKLCKWLATLLLPPAEYAPRRLLVPFSGVGSEMIGAGLAGWDFVLGIEIEQEYVDIAEARLSYWLAQPQLVRV